MPDDDGLLFTVKLTPKASKNAVLGWEKDAYDRPYLKATVTAVPEKGKANKALVNLLAKEWGIPKSSIELVRGETDRTKLLKLNEIPACAKDFPP